MARLTLASLPTAGECAECLKLLVEPGSWVLTALRLAACPLDAVALAALGAALRRHGGWEPKAEAEGCGGAEAEAEAESEDAAGAELFVGEAAAAAGAEEEAARPTGAPAPPPGLRSLAVVDSPGVPADAWSPLWRDLPSSLSELDLSGNGLSDHAVNAVCGAFRGRHCPEILVLRGNRCKDIERLCILIETGGLHALDLADNLLNDKSLAQLCAALASSRAALAALQLSGNLRIAAAGHRRLAEQLARSPLRRLALARTALGDADAAVLAAALPHCTLDELRAEATKLSNAGARQLLAAAQDSPGVASLSVDEDGQRVQWRRCMDPADVLSFTAPMAYCDWG